MDGKSLDLKSLDLKQDKIEKLKAALGEDVEFKNEGYVLNRAGKTSEQILLLQLE